MTVDTKKYIQFVYEVTSAPSQDYAALLTRMNELELEHDADVSKLLTREMNMSQAGDELIKSMLRTANGRLTCAEALGHREFVMTKLYRSA